MRPLALALALPLTRNPKSAEEFTLNYFPLFEIKYLQQQASVRLAECKGVPRTDGHIRP